jgi:hypothetical protein
MTDAVAVVEMIAPRVIEVHRELNQAKPENAGVEIEVTLRVTSYGGNMMDSHQ